MQIQQVGFCTFDNLLNVPGAASGDHILRSKNLDLCCPVPWPQASCGSWALMCGHGIEFLILFSFN